MKNLVILNLLKNYDPILYPRTFLKKIGKVENWAWPIFVFIENVLEYVNGFKFVRRSILTYSFIFFDRNELRKSGIPAPMLYFK